MTDTTQTAADGAQNAGDIALGLYDQALDFVTGLLRPWNAYQVGIIVAIAVAAWVLARLMGPRIDTLIAGRARILAPVRSRLTLIVFVALAWASYLVMQEITWPSRSYMIGIVAKLSLGWVTIAILTRMIGNGFLRSTIRYLGWIWITLSVLNLTDDTIALLDSAALTIGDTRLSLWLLAQGAFSITCLFVAAKFIATTSTAKIKSNSDISPSMQVLVIKFLQVVLYGAAFFLGLKSVGFDLTGLAVLSGAIGVGLGFGLQKVVSNLVSGIIILLDKSIKPGDVISLGDTFGWIESLGARYVSVVTRDGREYLIPNEDLITGQVVNWSHSNDFVRLDLHFGTAYGDDPHQVRAIAINAALTVPRVLGDRKPVCHIVNFGNSSVDYVLRFWIKDPTSGLTNIRGDVYLALWDAFQSHNITIPFPQSEVRILNATPQLSD